MLWYGILLGRLINCFNTLRPRLNGCHFPDDIFKRIFLNQNVPIPINISLQFVPKGPINNIQALFQIMAWHRPGDKPLSETMLVSLLTHICVTRPQSVHWTLLWYVPVETFSKKSPWMICKIIYLLGIIHGNAIVYDFTTIWLVTLQNNAEVMFLSLIVEKHGLNGLNICF